jgi:drug/metabolite transporter (DMT)-like permease
LFGFVCVLPFGWQEFNEINWSEMPQDVLLRVLFVILGSTYLAYLLNTLALKWANPSLVSGYIYLQPVLATIFAMALGSDDLSLLKIVSACFIFSGVYLISKKPQLS